MSEKNPKHPVPDKIANLLEEDEWFSSSKNASPSDHPQSLPPSSQEDFDLESLELFSDEELNQIISQQKIPPSSSTPNLDLPPLEELAHTTAQTMNNSEEPSSPSTVKEEKTAKKSSLYEVDSPKEKIAPPKTQQPKASPLKLGHSSQEHPENKDAQIKKGRIIQPHAGSVQSLSFKEKSKTPIPSKLFLAGGGGILLLLLLTFLFWPPPSVDDLLKNGDYQKALPLLTKTGRWEDVGFAYAKLGKNDDAIEAYKKAHLWLEAATLALKEKRLQEAAHLFVKAHAWKKAAETFLKIRDFASAGPLFERSKEYDNAIEAYKQARNWEKVAQLYEQLREPKEAAQFYVKAQKWSKAAYLFRQLHNWQQAALYFQHARMPLQEAQSLLKWGKYDDALKLFSSIPLDACAAAIFQVKKKFKKAGKLYEKAANLGENALLRRLAAISFERKRRFRSSRRNIRKHLALALKYHRYFKAFKLYEQMGRRRSGLRKLRRLAKKFLKKEEPWLANLVVAPLLQSEELTFAEKIPFTQLAKKIAKKLARNPFVVSYKKNLIAHPNPSQSPPKYTFQIQAELKLPFNGMLLSPLYLSCYLFDKDILAYSKLDIDPLNHLEFCANYHGDLASFRHFYNAPEGFYTYQKIGPFDDKQKQSLSFTIQTPLPYKTLLCTLQQNPLPTPQKSK